MQVTDNTREEVTGFGIEVLDVRIKRADLPQENSQAVFGRMEAERARIAKRYRSEPSNAPRINCTKILQVVLVSLVSGVSEML